MKIKYLKTENATITLEYNKGTLNKLKEEISELESVNFERINIVCDCINIKEMVNILDNIPVCNIPIFIKLYNYCNKYEKDLRNLNERFYVIVITNIEKFKKITKFNDIYYEIKINFHEAKNLLEILEKYTNIIINMETFPLSRLNDINNSLNYISNNATNPYLYFENLFIDKKLIYKCPYNIYLNNKNSKRKYGKNIPRNIYIDSNYKVYAAKIKNDKLIIGNYKKNNIIEILCNCKKSIGYKNFINYNKKLFFELLDQCPFNTIDYISFLNEVITHD